MQHHRCNMCRTQSLVQVLRSFVSFNFTWLPGPNAVKYMKRFKTCQNQIHYTQMQGAFNSTRLKSLHAVPVPENSSMQSCIQMLCCAEYESEHECGAVTPEKCSVQAVTSHQSQTDSPFCPAAQAASMLTQWSQAFWGQRQHGYPVC